MVVLASCFIATAVPFLINKYGFHLPLPTDTRTQGTCRIASGFQIDCLPDYSSAAVGSEAAQLECERRFCCWDNSTGLNGNILQISNYRTLQKLLAIKDSLPTTIPAK